MRVANNGMLQAEKRHKDLLPKTQGVRRIITMVTNKRYFESQLNKHSAARPGNQEHTNIRTQKLRSLPMG